MVRVAINTVLAPYPTPRFYMMRQLREVLNTKLFSLEKAALAPGWLKELR